MLKCEKKGINSMKKLAFTLAEVLITLAIVGVVAVLTIPTVTNNMSQRSNIVKLEATIKSLNDAINNLMIDERVTDIGDSSLTDDLSTLFNYLKISGPCGGDNFNSCFVSEYTSILGESGFTPFYSDDEGGSAELPNGAAIQLTEVVPGETASIYIDVNGPKGPNVVGRDMFSVRVFTNGLVGSDSAGDDEDDIISDCKNASTYGLDCVYLLETNGWVMDY